MLSHPHFYSNLKPQIQTQTLHTTRTVHPKPHTSNPTQHRKPEAQRLGRLDQVDELLALREALQQARAQDADFPNQVYRGGIGVKRGLHMRQYMNI